MAHRVDLYIGFLFLGICVFVFAYCGAHGLLNTTYIAMGLFSGFLGALDAAHYIRARIAEKKAARGQEREKP